MKRKIGVVDLPIEAIPAEPLALRMAEAELVAMQLDELLGGAVFGDDVVVASGDARRRLIHPRAFQQSLKSLPIFGSTMLTGRRASR